MSDSNTTNADAEPTSDSFSDLYGVEPEGRGAPDGAVFRSAALRAVTHGEQTDQSATCPACLGDVPFDEYHRLIKLRDERGDYHELYACDAECVREWAGDGGEDE